MNGNDLWKKAGIGFGMGLVSGLAMGGITGGIDAKMDGRKFWNGERFTREIISSDIPIVGQNGPHDCGPAGVEGVDRSLGGDLTKEKVRGWYPRESKNIIKVG
jgi:hypothetical protein